MQLITCMLGCRALMTTLPDCPGVADTTPPGIALTAAATLLAIVWAVSVAVTVHHALRNGD